MAEMISSSIEMTDEAEENQYLTLFQQYSADLHIILQEAHTELASLLWEKGHINHIMFENIISPDASLPSQHQMARGLLFRVLKLLMLEETEAARPEQWDKLINALEKESMWKPQVDKLKTDAEEARRSGKVQSPEAAALRKNMDMIATTIQGGLLQFANECHAHGIINLQDKQRFTNPNNSRNLVHTQTLLDHVETLLERGTLPSVEKVFQDFIEILKRIGGPVEDTAQLLERKAAKQDIN